MSRLVQLKARGISIAEEPHSLKPGLEERAAATSEYRGNQVAIERLSADAWLAYLEGPKGGGAADDASGRVNGSGH